MCTFSGLDDILKALVLRSTDVSTDILSVLQDMRSKIAILDDRMFDILGARMELTEEVGRFKRENNVTILQQEHWTKVIAARIDRRDDHKLTKHFVRQLMDAIHQESIRHQTRIMNPDNLDTEK